MDWNDWQRVLKWRALEEGDADGVLVNAERRREATAHTRAGLASEEIIGDVLEERSESFLDKRAEWLEREAVGWRGELIRVLELLCVPQGRWSWALAGWALALLTGYWFTDLGQAGEFNLLALPLVGLLAWNAVVIILGLLCELMPTSAVAGRGGWVAEFLAHGISRMGKASKEVGSGVAETVRSRYEELAWPLAWRRLQMRLRMWLHVAAALLAIGGAAALYARGWSHEYRAAWESTLLGESEASAFFETLFKPASKVLRVPIPLDQIPGMHRTAGKVDKPAPALPWIHLYAGTLLVLIVLPRLLLAGLGAARCCRVVSQPARTLSWGGYLRALLRAVEGGSERIQVLVHAIEPTATHREVWDRGVRERFGGMARAEYVRIPAGEEDEFAAAWQPVCANLVMIFNMATTPEAEVQRRLVSDVRQRLLTKHAEPELIVLLDGTSLAGRWSPEKIAGREQLWSQMVEGLASEVIVAVRKESARAKPPAS
ncbi:MAG: DUF2868 domain-containing protein [Prosthecobacter sp.]|uniref:DUF2868 domain-containing protein n=1 Tax=Prosthecobacter sp. TaxID=1965333 RepID=UPI0025ED020D|nr:DUF2868 domain-containing protein [Prosthecobacter sp.]MCF7784771.1 DUF2868 domain-containing protein [Prosthecobacter sp.]